MQSSFVFLLALVASCLGGTYRWLGTRNDRWIEPNNWSPFGIPGSEDEAIINNGGAVLVGTPAGASADSIVVSSNSSLTISGTTLKVGSLSVSEAAYLKINTGNGSLIVTGTASITSSRGADYFTGSITGTWKIGTSSSFTFQQGTVVNIASLTNNGVVSASVPRLFITIQSFTIGSTGAAMFSSGSITINNLANDGQVAFNNEIASVIASSGSGRISASTSNLTGSFVNLNIADSQTIISGNVVGLTIAKSATPLVKNLRTYNTAGGNMAVVGELTLAGPTTISGITFNGGFGPSGTINFQKGSTGAIDWIHYTFAGTQYLVVDGDKSGITVGTIHLDLGELNFMSGALSVDFLNASGSAVVITAGANLTVTHKFDSSALLDLNGVLIIPEGAQLTATNHFAPRAGEGLRLLINNGNVIIPVLTSPIFHNFFYSGQGSISVQGSLDFQNITLNVNTLNLALPTARITGEGLTLQYTTLNAPAAGNKIEFFGDGSSSSCTSPCGPSASHFYQQVSVWVSL